MSKAKKGLRLSGVKTFPHLSRKQQLNFLLPHNLNSFIIFSFRELSNQSCEWFYNNVKKKFKRFGSAKVVRSLYKRKSECKYYVFTPSFIHRLNHLFIPSFIYSLILKEWTFSLESKALYRNPKVAFSKGVCHSLKL